MVHTYDKSGPVVQVAKCIIAGTHTVHAYTLPCFHMTKNQNLFALIYITAYSHVYDLSCFVVIYLGISQSIASLFAFTQQLIQEAI